ncbi:MAG: hypothetical protein Q7U97_03100 [Rhodocyclaceae bacterium]|nr:hypothetical protein [Rhodocyclaceae bacterium]
MSALQSNWRQLFDQALSDADGNKTVVADQLGVSRTMVSLVAADKYHSRLDKFAQVVLDAYDGFDCPHLGSRVTANDCKTHALRACPTSSAREARHWRACQGCANKPEKESHHD